MGREENMLDLKVTNQNLVVLSGGSKHPDSGHRFHYPIWVSEEGDEYLYVDGQRPIELGQTGLKGVRETVTR